MDGNHTDIAGDFVSRVGSGAQPPRLSELESGSEAPPSVQSALSQVRPDDLDAIFDGALFGPPALESPAEASVPAAATDATPVPVGAMDWYMERDAQPAGPFRLERLRELWHQGAFDPDTLFWCEAWSTWRPLARVPELVAAMTVSGLPTVVADASVSPAPVPAKTGGSEKKALSTLHSLVAEEEGFLRKQQEEKEQRKEEVRSALLDESSAPVVAPHLAPAPEPVVPPAPPVMAPVPVVAAVPPQAPPVVPYPGLPMAPPLAPGMMAAPFMAQEPAPSRRGKTFVAGALIGSAAVGLVVGALLLLPQVRGAREPVADVSPRPAPAVPQAAAPAQPVAVTPVPQPAPQAVAPVQPVAVAPVPQALAATAPVKPEVKPAPVAVQPEKPKPAVVPAATAVESKGNVGHQGSAPAVSGERIASAAGSAPQPRRQTPPPPEPVAPAPVSTKGHKAPQEEKAADDPTNLDDSLDKEFEKQLGFSKDAPKYKPEDPRSKRSVYIPPEPGKELPESLSTSDVMQVVSSHKEAIVSCIEAHKPAHTSDSGRDRFVVRWRVLPTGDAVDALVETEGLQGTPFARCIEGQVRSWKFPQHRVQSREPVRFPFTY